MPGNFLGQVFALIVLAILLLVGVAVSSFLTASTRQEAAVSFQCTSEQVAGNNSVILLDVSACTINMHSRVGDFWQSEIKVLDPNAAVLGSWRVWGCEGFHRFKSARVGCGGGTPAIGLLDSSSTLTDNGDDEFGPGDVVFVAFRCGPVPNDPGNSVVGVTLGLEAPGVSGEVRIPPPRC
jgi:hypothetical protein